MPILTWPLASPDLNAVAAISGTGLVERLGTGAWTTRAIATADVTHITVTNGSGVVGNPTLDIGTAVLVSTGTYSDPSWITHLAWSKITSTPTSLAGYGILDPIVLTSGSYANPSWITSLAWAKLTGTPTTLAGYGITDPVVLTTGSYSNPAWLTSLAWSKVTGTPTTAAGYGITGGAQLDTLAVATITPYGYSLLACANTTALLAVLGLTAAQIRTILGVTQKSIGYCDSGTPTTSTFLIS